MSGKTYLYREIYTQLKREIIDGTLKPDDRLPSEDELCETYKASKITIRKALELLKDEGLIQRIQGHGSFVREPVQTPSPAPSETPNRKLIGIVLEHVSSSFGLDMMYHIMMLLEKEGYKTCVRFSFGSIEKESEELEDLLSMNVAGLIIMPCHDSQYNMTILKLLVEGYPVVLIDKRMYGLPIHSVCTDGRDAIRRLIHHLQERGCANAALLTIDPASTSSLGDRTEGFYTGLEETGMKSAGELILPRRTSNMVSSEPEAPYVSRIMEYLKSLTTYPDSFVCTEYAIARALYHASRCLGLEPGSDFKACCIDETELATQGIYFTCMRQDEEMIARHTARILLNLLRGKTNLVRDVSVPAIFFQGRTS